MTSGITLPRISRCRVAAMPVVSGKRRRMARIAAAVAIDRYWAHSGADTPARTPMLRRISMPNAEHANITTASVMSARR